MESTKKKNRSLLLLVFAAGFIPLIVRSYSYQNGYTQFDWFPNYSVDGTDYFLFWKMIFIIITGCLMTIIMIVNFKRKKLYFESDPGLYIIFSYALLVLFSAVFSSNKPWVFTGAYEVYEPVWCVIFYIVFCYYAYYMVKDDKQVMYVLKLGGIGVLFLTVIGTFQTFGLDIFNWKVWKILVTNPFHWDSYKNLTVTVSKGVAYGTLYNQNYFSFYCGMTLPVIIGMLIYSRRMRERIVLTVALILSTICLWGSRSSSGWLALGIVLIILTGILLSRKKKWFICYLLGLLTLIVIGGVIGNTTFWGKQIASSVFGTYHLDDVCVLHGIETADDYVELNINENILRLSYDYDEETRYIVVYATDKDGRELSTTPIENGSFSQTIDDPAYQGCMITPLLMEKQPVIDVELDNMIWAFSKGDDGTYYCYNTAQKWIKIQNFKSAKIFNDDAFSGRGRIWNNTIPLLKKYLLLGCGANTYALIYPQYDYVYSFYISAPNVFDVKAHSWYLMQWVENGLPAMLLLVLFYALYLCKSVYLYRNIRLSDNFYWIGFGIFAATLTYMIVALTNDSNVCTAPMFWVLLGLGMAVNKRISLQKKIT